MKLIGFAQLHNELQKGNLINWLKCMEVCDYVYIFDQNSTDGSKEIYKKHDNVRAICSPINDFINEIKCKSILLELLLNDHPDADWILWMDGDTLLERKLLRKNKLKKILKQIASDPENFDGVSLGHLNLWRSDLYYRVDSNYDWLDNKGVVAFWRNKGKLSFQNKSGLHKRQFPDNISTIATINGCLIHKGFSTDSQIINRYNMYKENGQSGEKLDRLINETNLQLEVMDKDRYPEWYTDINDVDPTTLQKINENI